MKPRDLENQYRARLDKLYELCSTAQVEIDRDSVLEHLLRKQFFEIAFVGEFSAGKSTLINALLGVDLLPTRLEPTTARVTKVRYAETPRIRLILKDTSIRSIEYSPEAIKNLIASNPESVAEVSSIDIEYPSDFLKDGFVFVDTPGMNDVSEARMKITYELLPEVDAVVYLSTYPVTESNLESFKTHILGNHIERAIIVLNKRDKVYSQPQDKIDYLLSSVRLSFEELYKGIEGMKETVGNIPYISADDYLSGLLGHEEGTISDLEFDKIESLSHFDEFATALNEYLVGSAKYETLAKQYEYRYERLRLQALEALEIRMDSIVVPEDEFNARTEKLKKNLLVISGQVSALKDDSDADLDALLNRLYQSFDTMSEEVIEQVSLTIDSYQGEANLLMRNIEMMVRRRYEEWRLRSEAILGEIVQGIQNKVKARFGKIVDDLQTSVAEFHAQELSEYSTTLRRDTRVQKITDMARARTTMQLASGILTVALYGVVGPISAILLPAGFIFADRKRSAEIKKIREQVMLRLRIDSGRFKDEIRQRIEALKGKINEEVLSVIEQYTTNVNTQVCEVEKQRQLSQKSVESRLEEIKTIKHAIEEL